MKRQLLLMLVGVVAATAIGCAVQGTSFEKISSPPGNAVIYVYRPYSYGSSALRPAVTCGEETARIGPGGYHAFIVPADQKVSCTMTTDQTDEVEFDTYQRVYYVREELGWGWLTGVPHLNPVDNDKAQSEIQQCKLETQPPPEVQQSQQPEPQTTGSAK
ncbi:MAG TPA: hypothetical protein VGR40_05135 [Candidatus Binatus sp.]|nr:hypothetical protein [Candidatus Binatus sp.]